MRIFLVTINTGTDFYHKAEQIIAELGAESYSAQEEFWPDGVQDPYRAIDESDVVLWVQDLSPHIPLKGGDYNLLYGDSVLNRAVTSGKPVFYYQISEAGTSSSFPQILQHTASKRSLESLSEIEPLLRTDLSGLIASN